MGNIEVSLRLCLGRKLGFSTNSFSERYLQLLKTAKVRGYKQLEQNYLQDPSEENYVHTNYPTAREAMGSKGSDYRLGNSIGPKGERS